MSQADGLDIKYKEMTETPVRKLVWRLAIPSIISMTVTSVYNLVDAIYIGKLSTEATAGIGISFAYMTIIQAVGFFFGHGSGNHISRALGSKHREDASQMASVGFFTPMIIGVIMAFFCTIYITPLSIALGATPDVVPFSNDYMRYIILATPFMMSALTLNNQLRLQGNARFGMIGIVSGALLNIILDPLFIFTFKMGVTGASLATAVSQFISWSLLLWGTQRKESVHIHWKNFRPTWKCYNEIFRGGLPSLCRQTFNGASAICLNHAAAYYASPGHEASTIAAFAVVSRVMMFAFSLVLGFSQGFQPVSGYNYGAHRFDRVRESYLYALKGCTIMLTVISVIGLIFAPQIIMMFRSEDAELVSIGARVLRWQCIAFPLVGLSTVTNMLFQNIRMTFRSTILSIGRQGLFFLPILFILPQFLGLKGVEMTQAAADLCTFLLAIPYSIWINRILKQKTNEQSSHYFPSHKPRHAK